MKRLLTFSFLLFAPSLQAQTTYLVDGQGVLPPPPVGITKVNSISAAASVAVSGDTILIWGMVDNGAGGSGKPVPYSDNIFFFLQQGAEAFPIQFAHGVSVRRGGPRKRSQSIRLI